MNSADLKKALEALHSGDLVVVEWSDASVGSSIISREDIDVPVNSYGVYLGTLGRKAKHIVLCQNAFCYTDGIYDVDYTAIPLGWISNIKVIQQTQVGAEDARGLLNSFLLGRARTVKRRTRNHEHSTRD